jgi:hypothetical protein
VVLAAVDVVADVEVWLDAPEQRASTKGASMRAPFIRNRRRVRPGRFNVSCASIVSTSILLAAWQQTPGSLRLMGYVCGVSQDSDF